MAALLPLKAVHIKQQEPWYYLKRLSLRIEKLCVWLYARKSLYWRKKGYLSPLTPNPHCVFAGLKMICAFRSIPTLADL